jgi:uncharacterized membrane protein
MDDTLIATAGWAGHERRMGQRRIAATFPAEDERRSSGERRASIDISRPVDPGLALDDRDRTLGGVGGEHEAIPSLAAIGGHPIHPMLVPLPIGAFALTVLSDAAFAATGDRFFVRASRALTAVGIASGLAAAAAGALDFVGRKRVRDHPAAWLHAGGNVAAVGLSAISLATRLRNERAIPPGAVALSAGVGTILLITGWLGGELAYRHRVGVTRDPGGWR